MPPFLPGGTRDNPAGISAAESGGGNLAALIAAAVLGGLLLICALATLFRRLRRRCRRGARLHALEGFSELLQGAELGDSSKARQLDLLRAAARNVVRKGDAMAHIVDEVQAMLAARAKPSAPLSIALDAEWVRLGYGKSTPTDAEKLQLLTELFEPPLPSLPPPEMLNAAHVTQGFGGGGGVRLAPPKLLPYATATLPAAVIDEAHAAFLRQHGRAAASDHEALLSFREALEPYVRQAASAADPMHALPEKAVAAVAAFGGVSDVELASDSAHEARARLQRLTDALDLSLSQAEAEAMLEGPSDLAHLNGGVLGDVPLGDGGGSGVRLRPPRLAPAERLSRLEAAAEAMVETALAGADEMAILATVPLARCMPGRCHPTGGGPGGVRIAPPKLTPVAHDSAWEAEMEEATVEAEAAQQTGTTAVVGDEELTGDACDGSKAGGGIRLRPPRLNAVAVDPPAVPTFVLDQARALYEEREGVSVHVSDAECLAVLRDALHPSAALHRQPSRVAPNRGFDAAAAAFSAELAHGDDDGADAELIEELRTLSVALPASEKPTMLAALKDEVDKTIAAAQAERAEHQLDVTAQIGGYDGCGGVRLKPPKLSAPLLLQPPPLSAEVEQALAEAFETSFGADTGTFGLEEMAATMLSGYHAAAVEEATAGSDRSHSPQQPGRAHSHRVPTFARLPRPFTSARKVFPAPALTSTASSFDANGFEVREDERRDDTGAQSEVIDRGSSMVRASEVSDTRRPRRTITMVEHDSSYSLPRHSRSGLSLAIVYDDGSDPHRDVLDVAEVRLSAACAHPAREACAHPAREGVRGGGTGAVMLEGVHTDLYVCVCGHGRQDLKDNSELLGALLGPKWAIHHEMTQMRSKSWWLMGRWLMAPRGKSTQVGVKLEFEGADATHDPLLSIREKGEDSPGYGSRDSRKARPYRQHGPSPDQSGRSAALQPPADKRKTATKRERLMESGTAYANANVRSVVRSL